MSNWQNDDAWQKGIRDRFMPPIYRQWTIEGRFVFFEKSKCSTLIQKRAAVDTALQTRRDLSVCIEEKFARWPGYTYTAFFLETDSCTLPHKHSKGWMHYALADQLLYAFVQNGEKELDAYLIKDFQKLKEWFWTVYEKYPESTMPGDNRTRGRVVPIKDVALAIEIERYRIADRGMYWQLPCVASLKKAG